MRYPFLLACLSLTCLSQFSAASPIDSLRTALVHAEKPAELIRIYRNLADITAETAESCGYLIPLFEQTKATRQTGPMMEALTDLTNTYLKLEKVDSARYYAALAEEVVPKEQHDQWCSYLRMRIFYSDLVGAEAEQAVNEKIAKFKDRDISRENLYMQIEAEFALGAALDSKGQTEEATSHLLNAMQLAEKLPLREGAPYQLFIMRVLTRSYNIEKRTQDATKIAQKSIEVKEKYYELYDKPTRPYLSLTDFYISTYTSILINLQNMPDDEVRHYLDLLIEMSDRSNSPAHKYNRFHAQFNYSIIHNKVQQALAYNDSLIYYARRIATYNLPNLYNINALVYEFIGRDKEALDNLHIAHSLQDSIRRNDMQTQVDKMRMEYDVNRLNYEKSRLQIRNKHILLATLSIFVLAVGGICIQLFRHLRRERRRKEHMQQLQMQAEESEKLKTAFINSICHEIRTPLNGIVGYTTLLLDPAVAEEERATFPKQIEHNTAQLLTLIDSMLEVSSLNVSDEKLPCTPVDVVELCRKTFGRFSAEGRKNGVVSIARLPNEPLVIASNGRYLQLVVENLLSNAYKFTERGSVTLCCERSNNGVMISITDTGYGIPAEKHQAIFERFLKLDPHKQGNGLGLYLCAIIVRRLSGNICVAPDYTQGARMVVTLPGV